MFVLKKWPCSRAEWSELPCKLSHSKQLLENIHPLMLAVVLTYENIFTVVTQKNPKNHQLYATAATEKKDVSPKRLCTRSTFRQSLMASVGESQVSRKHQVWYLLITESMLLTAAIATWWCHNDYCPSCVRSQASSSSFSRTVLSTYCARGSLTDNFTRYQLILKILSAVNL